MDFERLTRLQRFLKQTRVALQRGHPHPAPHSTFVDVNMPHGLTYALGGDRALQIWYRDSTLHLESFDRFRRQPDQRVEAIIQFQPDVEPEIFILDPAAARIQEQAYGLMKSQRIAEALAGFDRADSLEPDPAARVFHANNAGLRANLLVALGHFDAAEREGRRGLALFPRDENSRFVIARELVRRNQLEEAKRQLDSLLHYNPALVEARMLLDRITGSGGTAPEPRGGP
jgi:tetratricopeptide (TPR) repeat protein